MLRTGSPQALCYAAVVMMPQLNGNGALDLFTRNYVFKAGFWAWLSAQTLKVVPSGHVIFCICPWLCICTIPWQNMQHITWIKLGTPIMACTGLPNLMVMLKSGVSHPRVRRHLLICTAAWNADLHEEDQAGRVGHPGNRGFRGHAILALSSLHCEFPGDGRCLPYDVNGILSCLIE